jgi:hypothetical protein
MATGLTNKFDFAIQQAMINKELQNLNVITLDIDKWPERFSLFTAKIIVDVTKRAPIPSKLVEAGSYSGTYYFEINGQRLSKPLRGLILDRLEIPVH